MGLVGSAAAYHFSGSSEPVRARAEESAKQRVTEQATNAPDVARLRAELALVQGQINQLRAREADSASARADAAPAPAPEELDPETLRAQREESDRQWKDHMAEVAMDFEQEVVDRRFESTAKSAIQQELQNNPTIQAVAGDVECRTHTCRLEIRDARNPDVSKQLQLFVHKLGPTLPRAQADQVEQPDGQTSLVLYMTNQEPVAQGPGR